jgi:hypothetical protein
MVSGQVIEAIWRGTINFQTIYIPGWFPSWPPLPESRNYSLIKEA